MVASLTESMAAGRQTLDYVGETRDFDPETESLVIVGAGQMAMNILLQARMRWKNLTIIVMARKKEDREMAIAFGADHAIELAQEGWTPCNLEDVLAAAECPDPTLCQVQDKAKAYRTASTHNAAVHQQNVVAFKEARKIAGEQVACVLECTGQAHILNAALEARCIRGDGSYGLVSCLYALKLDVANLRRDGAWVWNLRRSRNQFLPVLQDLRRNEAYYRQMFGSKLPFDEAPRLYTEGYTGVKIGDGPKVVVEY
jgi:threonine dehydrogenase-like Zn-dependent dehydrogenase